ncbi:hypothetical protein HPB47_003256 [Ixodes persulcatus]|uniref:Uncharacterized protein n=1 Tax=Ixodes persulcatus TaxID=34615 RepID=A0AC60PJC8_IXOPE|nr:hypothetical protein HPB47_003256 [Ixodes persulcatus]
MKEKNLVRHARAFVVSRLAYVLPFLRLGVAEKAKLDCLIRKAYKARPGVASFEKLGIRYERRTGEKVEVLRRVREKLTIANLPSYMHPVHLVERRTARANALGRILEKEEGIYYTNAARYDRNAMAAAVVDKQGKIVASCSVRTTEPEVAEEVVIALALKQQDAKIVVSDSQMVIRQYAKGRISPVTLRVLGGSRCGPRPHSPGRSRVEPLYRIVDWGRQTSRVRRHPRLLRRGKVAQPSGASFRGQETSGSVAATTDRPLPVLASSADGIRISARETASYAVQDYTDTKKITNQENWEALLCSDLKVKEQVVRQAENAAGVQEILAAA